MATMSQVKKKLSRVFEIPREISWHLMSKNELIWKQKIHHKSLHGEIEVRRPTLMFFETLFKELFQNVEVEDEQLWSIDE